MLADITREVENAVRRPPTRPAVRTQFQVAALLVREERARVKADTALTPAKRDQQLKRLDGGKLQRCMQDFSGDARPTRSLFGRAVSSSERSALRR